MKTIVILTLVSTLSLGLTGCGESRATTAQPEPTPAATYKAGHGVQLSPRGREFVSLQTGEVGSHAFAGAAPTAAIPVEALLRTIKGDFVYVANGEWFLRTQVKLGAANATHIEIKEGLYEGDTIVVKGMRGLSLAEIQALNGGVGCADGH